VWGARKRKTSKKTPRFLEGTKWVLYTAGNNNRVSRAHCFPNLGDQTTTIDVNASAVVGKPCLQVAGTHLCDLGRFGVSLKPFK